MYADVQPHLAGWDVGHHPLYDAHALPLGASSGQTTTVEIPFGLIFIWTATWSAIPSFGVGGSDFKPTAGVFFCRCPVLFFNFVGSELPSAAGDEMKDPQKDVPVTIRRAWLIAILAYGLPVLAILLVLPKDQITNLGGFVDAIKTVFTVFGGSVAADGTATLTGSGVVLGGVAAIGFILAVFSSD